MACGSEHPDRTYPMACSLERPDRTLWRERAGARSLATGPSEEMTLSPSCVTDSVHAGPPGRRATLAKSQVLFALT